MQAWLFLLRHAVVAVEEGCRRPRHTGRTRAVV